LYFAKEIEKEQYRIVLEMRTGRDHSVEDEDKLLRFINLIQ